MSGTYDIQKWLEGEWFEEFYHQSPLQFLPGLPEGDQLNQLRSRFVLLATGQGDHEAPDESWKVADALGAKGISNRVDLWDPAWKHDWDTWREMLPKYVQEMLAGLS
jgi:esterase/lipase superfamily enzyme